MTALEITKALKADRNAVLWINEDRNEAAFHAGATSHCVPVKVNDAIIAKGDPAFCVVDQTDGVLYAVF